MFDQGPGRGRGEITPGADADYTLIELLVVILILAILAAMIIPRIVGRAGDAKVSAAKGDLAALNGLLETYLLDVGRYPSTEEGLFALLEEPADSEGWRGPYTTRDFENDPWGIPYAYENDGDYIFLASFGKDGVQDGEGENADIIERDD